MAAARPPYEIVKLYGSRIITDSFLDMYTFAAKFVRFFWPLDSGKADWRRFLMLTP